MMTDVCATAAVCGLLAGAIAFAWRISRSAARDPKTILPNTLMRHAAQWYPQGHLR